MPGDAQAPGAGAPGPDAPLTDFAAKIEEPTTMSGEAHKLIADPEAGKIELHSNPGPADSKLSSVEPTVIDEARGALGAALGKVTEMMAVVADPNLKPGATPAKRDEWREKLGQMLKEAAIAIRVFGDTGQLTDADPLVAAQVRQQVDQRLNTPVPSAAESNPPVPAPAPGSNAASAQANADAAASVNPKAGGLQTEKQGGDGRTPQQTAAVATADPQFGGRTDAEGRPTETVAEATARMHPDSPRDSNFNPAKKVEFEAALAREILANPGLYQSSVLSLSSKILTYIKQRNKDAAPAIKTALESLNSSPGFWGYVEPEMQNNESQLAAQMQAILEGGPVPMQLGAHGQFMENILKGDWKEKIAQEFVGELAVDPAFVRNQTRIKNGELDPTGTTVFDKKGNKPGTLERGRVDRPEDQRPPRVDEATAGARDPQSGAVQGEATVPGGQTSGGADAGTAAPDAGFGRGMDSFTMDETKAFVQRARLKLDMPVVAGISGTTAELVNCAMTMGLGGTDLHNYALACMGFLIGGGNHSFVEIATVLAAAGLPVDPDTYEGFAPPCFSQKFQDLKKQYPEAFKDGNTG